MERALTSFRRHWGERGKHRGWNHLSLKTDTCRQSTRDNAFIFLLWHQLEQFLSRSSTSDSCCLYFPRLKVHLYHEDDVMFSFPVGLDSIALLRTGFLECCRATMLPYLWMSIQDKHELGLLWFSLTKWLPLLSNLSVSAICMILMSNFPIN
jgi:hypothetical protein